MVINSSISMYVMLLMKQQCERCEQKLADEQKDVYICSYECTFCTECNTNDLHNVCPNCGGDLVLRPTRKSKE